MRVPADELGGDRLDDAAEIEQSRLLGHAGVEDDLQQKVAELLAKVLGFAALDRVGDLVGLLDGVGRNGREGLLDVPGTAGLRVAQGGHDLDQAMNVAGRLHRSSSPDGADAGRALAASWVKRRKERGFGPRSEFLPIGQRARSERQRDRLAALRRVDDAHIDLLTLRETA